MKVSRSKTEYLCINGGNDDKTVNMEDTKVPRVKEFKYLGSTVQESGGLQICTLPTAKRTQCYNLIQSTQIISTTVEHNSQPLVQNKSNNCQPIQNLTGHLLYPNTIFYSSRLSSRLKIPNNNNVSLRIAFI